MEVRIMLFKRIAEWKLKLKESIKLVIMLPKEKRYFLWKRAAIEAKEKGLTTTCAICGGSIFPGEFVAMGTLDGKEVIAHAGFHYAMEKSEPAFCETAAVGIGYWNAKGINEIRESAGAKAMKTGKAIAYNY